MPIRQLTFFLLLVCMTLVGRADGVENQSNKSKLETLHTQYLKSTNATNGEQLKESLQRHLDTNPTDLLSIQGLNPADICDGTDIDIDSGLDTKKMLRRVTKRIRKVNAANVNAEVKRACVVALEKFKSCVTSQGC